MRIVERIKHLKNALPRNARGFEKLSFSQYGEDLLAWDHLKGVKEGRYIEVGAYHPYEYSNTYHFYRHGWRGLLVEPNPDACRLLTKERPGDIVVNLGIADCESTLEYSAFEDGAYNGFYDEAERNRIAQNVPLIAVYKVATNTLQSLIDQHLKGHELGLLSIDTEGFELKVLQSIDWSVQPHPRVIICEVRSESINDKLHDPCSEYLYGKGYTAELILPKSVLFLKR